VASLPMKKEPYALGTAGIRQSIETLVEKAREARNDVDLRGWAIDTLTKAGLDGRDRPSVKARAQALVDGVRAQTIYVPDPNGTEWIQAPHVTLCLRNHCIAGGDCDDLFLAMLGAMLTVGLPAFIVRQQFGLGIQEHVLLGLKDESGIKLYVDPSTRDPVYSGTRAMREDWIDPMGSVGSIGPSSPELVTLGAPHGLAGISEGTKSAHRDLFYVQGHGWVERVNGRLYLWDGTQWHDVRANGLPSQQDQLGLGRATGFGIVLPSDVIAYRTMWNAYVVGVAQAFLQCQTMWQNAAAGQTNTGANLAQFASPPDATTLGLWENAQSLNSQSIMSMWNAHAGLSDAEIVLIAGGILQDFQNVVKAVGQQYVPQLLRDCPNIAVPSPPSFDLQAQVIGQIQGTGILANGVLQILGIGASGALDTAVSLGHWIKESADKVIDTATSWWAWALGAVIVGGGVAIAYAPEIKTALAAKHAAVKKQVA
jgi:hypothetical protein